MNKQRILKEAQKIAAKFSFWMVSGNIAHLYGYAYEGPDKKYDLEIKFGEDFPQTPPELVYHDEIKELLGEFQLSKLQMWTPDSSVVDIVHELKAKIQEALNEPVIIEEQELIPINTPIDEPVTHQPSTAPSQTPLTAESASEEYLTPDLNAYPPEFDVNQYTTPSNDYSQPNMFVNENNKSNANIQPSVPLENTSPPSKSEPSPISAEPEPASLAVTTELGLIQQYYAYDHKGSGRGDINVYMTITVSKTFIIGVNFNDYPEKPQFTFPDEVSSILGDPYQSLNTLKKWSKKSPPHIIDVLQELETKLFFIKDIETESKKTLGEYQCDMIAGSITKLRVHLLTYGFHEYLLDVDLGTYPKPPNIQLTPELKDIIQTPVESLTSYRNWKEKQSEAVEIIREISWLVDKNSRIKFEIELLNANYQNIDYDGSNATIRIDMKGKMKTQDLTFEFEIALPREYPMKVPEIKVINEFDIDIHEKTKNELQASFKNFFNDWTPFSYLVDLFNGISKKIFEVSVISCVICHKIDCPSCALKIAGPDEENCHIECPYCERAYHKHCWDQTIASFGKCGFCLKTPPPSMMP